MWFLYPLAPAAHLAAGIMLQTSWKQEVYVIVMHAQSAMESEAILWLLRLMVNPFHSYQSASYIIYL